MSLASSLSGIQTSRSGSRRYDGSESPLTPSSRRHSLLKPRRLQSAYYDKSQGVSKCRRCGWIYPHACPGARERRDHKKHCLGTIKVERWLAFADLSDSRKGLQKAEDQPTDDDRKASLNRAEVHSSATKGADGVIANNGTHEKGASETPFQGDDLEGAQYSGEGDKTQKTSLLGVTQFRSSHLGTSGVDTSELVAASEDAEVHDGLGINNVNKLQEEKQAGSGSLQDTTGTSIEGERARKDKHEAEDHKRRLAKGGRLSSASKNWEDWDDVVQEETTAHHGFRIESGDLAESQREKTDSKTDTEKCEAEIVELHGCPGLGHGSDQPRTEPAKQSLAERNWDDWDDVILQSSKLW